MSTDASSKSAAATPSSTSRDSESYQSSSSGNESNTQQLDFQRIGNNVTCSSTNHSTLANSERIMCTPIDLVQGTSQTPNEGRSVNKPFGQRAKKSFPQPKRFKIPQPVLGKDPNDPEIEVVEYVDKEKSTLQGLKVSNHTTLHNPTCPIFSTELNHDFLQHSFKKELNTDVISGGEEPQQTPNLSKTSHVPESEQNDESPVHTPDQSVFNLPCPARSSDYVTESKTSPLHASYRETSPTMQPCTPGPSGARIVNDEEMNRTVTSTTSLFPGVGSPIDEEHKRCILASMKQTYTSELSQADKKQGSESDASFNDTNSMPRLFKSPNSSCEADKNRPPSDLHADDSFDEELVSLAKKTLFSSSDSKTDLGMDSLEEVETNRESTTTSSAPIDLTHLTSLKPASSDSKPIPDLQEIHHPPTPALTPLNPLTDELEAAMAKLHGESLNEDHAGDEMAVSTNVVVTKIVEQHSASSHTGSIKDHASTIQSDSEYQPDSDDQEAKDKSEERKSPIKQYKFHKIGPKSKMGVLAVHKPSKLNAVDGASGEGGAAFSEAGDEAKAKPKSAATPRALARHSREVEKLCEDEMVQNMLRDIEERGLNKRRMSAITYKEFQSNSSDKEVRAPRRGKRVKKEDNSFEFELTPPKKKKMSRTTSTPIVESSPQDQVLQQWEPLHNPTNEDKVVYVPRKLANPADGSVIVRRRTFSSDSSADGNQNNKRKSLHSLEASTGVQRSLFTMNDHSYTSVKSSYEPGSATEDLVSKLSAKCEEIHISCRDRLLCIKLCSRTSILRNSLNSNILRELSMVLRKLKMETSVNVVLITSSGPDFCNGIDFPSLIHGNMAQRLESAMTIVSNLQEFIMELANCDKVLVGGLVGSVMGLGVAMLPYLDAVYACDKTSFCLPYVKLGQSYEGGLSSTLSMFKNLNSLLFYEGRRLTATQAKDCGLIQDAFLPDNFEKEVVLRACKMAAEFSQSSLAGKRMSHAALRRELPDVLKEESQLLRQTWISDDFQRRAKQLYANGDLLLS